MLHVCTQSIRQNFVLFGMGDVYVCVCMFLCSFELFIFVPITSNCCINRTWKSRALLWINLHAFFIALAVYAPLGSLCSGFSHSKFWLFIFWHGALRMLPIVLLSIHLVFVVSRLKLFAGQFKWLLCYRLWCKLNDWEEWVWEFMNLLIQWAQKSLLLQSLT